MTDAGRHAGGGAFSHQTLKELAWAALCPTAGPWPDADAFRSAHGRSLREAVEGDLALSIAQGKPAGLLANAHRASAAPGRPALFVRPTRPDYIENVLGLGAPSRAPAPAARLSERERGGEAALRALGKSPRAAAGTAEFERGREAALRALGKSPRAAAGTAEFERGREAAGKITNKEARSC